MSGPDCISPEARVAAEVAARYGVTATPDVVKFLPRGLSSFVPPVWNGYTLVHADPKKASWRHAQNVRAKRDLESPLVKVRRAEVARLHGLGWQDEAMASALNVSHWTVKADRSRLGLTANGDPALAEILQNRLLLLRQGAAAGDSLEVLAARLGLSRDYTQRLLREHGLTVARSALPLRASRAKPPELTKFGRAALRRARLQQVFSAADGAPSRAEILDFARREGIGQRRLYADLAALTLRLPPAPASAAASSLAGLDARQARREAVRRAWTPDISITGIADALGISRGTVRADLAKLGLSCAQAGQGMDAKTLAELTARRARIRDLAVAGKTRAEMSAELRLSCAAIDGHLAILGIKPRRAKRPRLVRGTMEATLELRSKIADLRARGLSHAAIAVAVGKSKATVSFHLSDMGLTDGRKKRAMAVAA
jgi:DNA-binding CsgD family transcriptional regulator/AraC-like DNA-binding protein